MADEEKKGFTVTDRRVRINDPAPVAEPEINPEPVAAEKPGPEQSCYESMPGMNFASFIISLNTSALIHLGLLPDPAGGQVEKQVELARQTIDLLDILKEKTQGNLSKDESDLLDNVLFDLRIKFLDVCK
jgi:hypothetical protein